MKRKKYSDFERAQIQALERSRLIIKRCKRELVKLNAEIEHQQRSMETAIAELRRCDCGKAVA